MLTRSYVVCLATLLLASALQSRAAVTLKSGVNGASYQNVALPNGKLAQGVLFIAFGSGMGPASIRSWRHRLPVVQARLGPRLV